MMAAPPIEKIRRLRSNGEKLGIVGEGVLGQRVADVARAFGMVPLFAAHKGVSGLGPSTLHGSRCWSPATSSRCTAR